MSEQDHALSLEAIGKIQSSVKFFAWALGLLISAVIAAAVWVTQIQDKQADMAARVTAIEQDRAIKVEQFNQMKTDIALMKQTQIINTSTLNRIAIKVGAGLPDIP